VIGSEITYAVSGGALNSAESAQSNPTSFSTCNKTTITMQSYVMSSLSYTTENLLEKSRLQICLRIFGWLNICHSAKKIHLPAEWL